MSLPTPTAQADWLIELGVDRLAGISASDLRDRASAYDEPGLLVTAAPPSSLAPLLRLDGREGFVVGDMTDVDDFAPVDPAPAFPYLVAGLDRGDDLANRSPAESVPEILAAGRTPLTLTEGCTGCCRPPAYSSGTTAS